jgi:hypothetical protein
LRSWDYFEEKKMKQIALDKLYLTPKLLMTALVILTLSIFSIIATAAEADSADAGGKSLGERFNHMATGFPLTGLHASAECGSCHVGGLFKGTARNCSGCHTKGQRVVATAMSSKHLVTTDPCETCHTNTVTFYGARYNHGKAVPGQCATCHNGFSATGRAASHKSGNKLSKSCDSCHRTFAWLPASWNHFGNTAKCVTCHVTGGEGAAFTKIVNGTYQEQFAHGAANNAIDCESCHRNYSTWYGATYDHAGAGTVCSSCHNSVRATGTAQKSGHVATNGAECSQCHTSTATWLGALGAAPSNHSLLNTASGCLVCHPGGASSHATGSTLHAYTNAPGCYSCHGSNRAVVFSSASTASWPSYHESSKNGSATDCSASGCHRPLGSKGSLYTSWH